MKQDVKTPERRVILVCNVYHLVWKGEEMRQPQPTKVTRRKKRGWTDPVGQGSGV